MSNRTSGGYGRAWYAVAVLLLLYCLSFTDRLILALLAPAVRESLGISDTQIGLLFGVGFGVLYALCGLPLAQLIDRSHRVRIVAAGVVLWSVCTVASGFANTFAELAILRSGVAIGEAVLSPAAISIIADMFPREKRTLPTSVYTSVGTFMTAGAFIAGGAALDVAKLLSSDFNMEPWRIALVLVGAPGLLFGPLFLFTVREPRRSAEAQGEDFASVGQALDYVRREARLYGSLFVAMGCYTIVTFSYTGWAPTVLIRAYAMQAETVGYAFGAIGAIAGVLGAAAAPAVASAWARAGRRDAIILLLAGGMTISCVSVFVTGVTRSESLVLALVGVLLFFGSVGALFPPLIVQYVTPGRMRARIMAGNFMATNLVGLAIGPALTAWIADQFFPGPFGLATSLVVVVSVFGPIAVLAVLFARRAYVKALDLAAEREAGAAAGIVEDAPAH